jgi:hypothetical protein
LLTDRQQRIQDRVRHNIKGKRFGNSNITTWHQNKAI